MGNWSDQPFHGFQKLPERQLSSARLHFLKVSRPLQYACVVPYVVEYPESAGNCPTPRIPDVSLLHN